MTTAPIMDKFTAPEVDPVKLELAAEATLIWLEACSERDGQQQYKYYNDCLIVSPSYAGIEHRYWTGATHGGIGTATRAQAVAFLMRVKRRVLTTAMTDVCPDCGQTTYQREGVVRHVYSETRAIQKVACPNCDGQGVIWESDAEHGCEEGRGS